jgi:hypothetical protein
MQVERHRAITVRYQDLSAEWHQASDDQNLSELSNMKLTISMAFSPSTGSLTGKRFAPVKNLKNDIEPPARMR